MKRNQAQAEDDVKDAFAMLTAEMSFPFAGFNNPTFRHMIETVARSAVQGGKCLWDAKTVRNHVIVLSDQVQELLKDRLHGQKVVATADHWTSCANENYGAFTVQYIDESFVLRQCVLAVYLYEESTTASEFIVNDFIKKVNWWGLTDSIRFVVTDTEAKMSKAGQLLSQHHGIEHIYCLDHLLQIVAVMAYDADILSNSQNVEDNDSSDTSAADSPQGQDRTRNDKVVSISVLKKVRRLVRYFKKSPQGQQQLRQIQKTVEKTKDRQVDVIQDVATRWWSTLSMLDRLFHIRESLIIFADQHGFPKQSKESAIEMFAKADWDALDVLRKVLKPFRSVQVLLEGNKYVTSSLVIYIVHFVRAELKEIMSDNNLNTSVHRLVEKMVAKLEEIFGSVTTPFRSTVLYGARNRQVGMNKALLFAHVLDPRFKTGPLGAEPTNLKELWKALMDEAVNVAMEKKNKCIADAATQDTATVASSVTGDAPTLLSTTKTSNFVWKYAKAYRVAAGVTERERDATTTTAENEDRSTVEDDCRHQIK